MTDNIAMEIETFLSSQTLHTRRSYEWALGKLFLWLSDKSISPSQITPELFTAFLDEQTWGPSTRRLATCAARAFYKWWHGSGSPMLTIKLRRVKTQPQRTLSPKQVVQLLAAVDPRRQTGRRDLAIIYLMLDTGLRESEVCNLLASNLDLRRRRLDVIVKGGEWGKAVFSAVTAGHLAGWIDQREALRGKCCRLSPQVFLSMTGEQLTPGALRDIFERLSKRAGFTVSPHDLRRTFAVLATRRGAPTKMLMQAGRWKDMKTLEDYLRGLGDIEPEDFEQWYPTTDLA